MRNPNEREREENIVFLDTVQQYKGQDDIMQIIQIVMNHFKFGHGGYNGYFENASDLFEEIEVYLKRVF